tara:strand:- start:15 stop:221 length:207 start_codon:yes stop_codon:yes gene_type:complete
MGQDEDQSAFVEKEKFLQRTPVIHNKNKRKEKKEGFGEGRPVLREKKIRPLENSRRKRCREYARAKQS